MTNTILDEYDDAWFLKYMCIHLIKKGLDKKDLTIVRLRSIIERIEACNCIQSVNEEDELHAPKNTEKELT